ncbi:MAG: hypothetical protein ACR2L6_12380 [Gemmatimonadaceae bacterium]
MRRPTCLATLAVFVASVTSPLSAQTSAPQPAPADTVKPVASARLLDLSGVIFANYQYRLGRGPQRGSNKFDVERVYLTFRAPAGDRASIRITTDLFQPQTSPNDSFSKGWVVRAKYAYLQYDYLRRGSMTAVARLGLVHNVFIDHDESYWPRWIGTVATDRHGYFSSADAGLVTLVTLPGKRGEFYAAVVNGPGYTSREVDRFKDYGARLTLTPFAGSGSSLWKTLDLTGWTYKGALGSRFATGAAGQIGPVGSSLERDRWGVFAAVRNSGLTLSAQYASRHDQGETGENTSAAPRLLIDSSGSLMSAYAMKRIFGGSGPRPKPVHLLARVDRVTTNRSTREAHHLVVGGIIWDLTSAASLALDYQELLPYRGSAAVPLKTVFLHLTARF